MSLSRLPGGPSWSLSAHTRALCEALLVTALWSSSYVFIRVGLADIPALTFAGLRYGLATLALLPVLVARGDHRTLGRATRRQWTLLVGLGVTLYAVTQGAQFVALGSLRAATVSVVLTATPVVVALGASATLDERPSRGQWVGIALLLAGAYWYFAPLAALDGRWLGLAVMGVGLLGNASGAILGRRLNVGALSPLAVTTPSMGVGAALLLTTGLALQGLPHLSLASWGVVGWLALVNTTFAFVLWNRSLQTLSAVESSVVNNTMLVQVALVGWVALGEPLAPTDWAALLVVGVGALVVQVRR